MVSLFNTESTSETGFDLVIGNPPYVGEKGNKDTFEPLKQSQLGKRFYQGKMDLFYFFFHHGLDLLKPAGILGYITTNYYITATGGTKLRNDFKQRSNVLKLINFGELKIFESALGQHNLITLLQKKPVEEPLRFQNDEKWNDKHSATTIITQNKGYLGSTVLENIINGLDPNTDYYQIPQSKLFDENGYIKLTSGNMDEILDKMLVGSERLGEICEINTGYFTSLDKVSNKHLTKYPSTKYEIGDGVFVINKQEYNKIEQKLNESEKKKILPSFKNSNIDRFFSSKIPENFLIDMFYPKDKNLNLSTLPIIKEHLFRFEDLLKDRLQINANGLNNGIKAGVWWLGAVRRKLDYNQPKIISPQRSNINTFAYNEESWYASSDVYFITQPKETFNLKFLLGVLNSKLIYKWLYYRGKRKGEMLELYQKPLSEIPIPILDTPHKQQIARQIETLVEEILDRRGMPLASQNNTNNGQASLAPTQNTNNTTDLESQIDKLVFELYGLSEEEVGIIKK